eukprot:GEMP01123188.1.p2 GENE.GEMP01123188.1~~GEMP01123188.1.p2  ORF type:complete len:113 (+),score=42.13 GEMP01123188.1:96-434(+)
MMKLIVLPVALAVLTLSTQDPCADCTETRAVKYQECARDFGDPCKKDGEGATVDIRCCRHKNKHNRCLECATRDCTHGTCEVNKKYYNFHHQKKEDKDFDKRSMKESGWGDF